MLLTVVDEWQQTGGKEPTFKYKYKIILKNLQYYANIVKATGKPHENSPIKIQESVVLKLFLRITKN